MSKLLLVDGHSILNRAFYGLPDLTCSTGEHTGAVLGFLTMLFREIEMEQPTHLTIAFDLSAPTFRHIKYEGYKGTRKPMQPELKQQVPMIKEMLTSMGVKVVTLEGYEADDLLGTMSVIGEKNGFDVTIFSGDRDLLQLATDKVKISIPKTKSGGTEVENYYAKEVQEKYLVTPKEFIDVKALWGDTSDNIPGVESIGEKTATNIIAQYHSIENAHAHADELKPPKAARMIVEQYDQAVLSKWLAAIDVEAPIEYDINDALLGNLYTPDAYVLCKKWELKKLLPLFENTQTDETIDAGKIEDGFKRLSFSAEIDELVDSITKDASTNVIGIDVQIGDGILKSISISDGTNAYYLPTFFDVNEAYLCEVIRKIAASKRVNIWDLKSVLHVMHDNAIFDLAERENTEGGKALLDNCDDITILAYLLNPTKKEYLHEDIASEYLSMMVKGAADIFGKTKMNAAFLEQSDLACTYACYRAYIASIAHDPMMKLLEEQEMMQVYTDIEHPLIYTLYDMEISGIVLDEKALTEFGEGLKSKISELEKSIYEAAGGEFNLNSPKQLGEVLFEKMGLPSGKKTKTGYSTSAEVLEGLAVDYPVVSDILEYRQLAKLESTYVEGLKKTQESDGRIHSTFMQTVTATGRISSTEPNLQNIPIRMELGRQIRKVFYPSEGCEFIDADYSQIELRVLAHLSQDDNLIAAFKAGQDIHRSTASLVFNTPFDEVTDLQRRAAKAVNFGIVYGISAFGLSRDIGCDRKTAQGYIDSYFVAYPKMKDYIDSLVASAKECGYAKTLYNRRRPIPDLQSSNFMTRQFGERVAMNSPIQGTAADIIKIAMVRVHDSLYAKGLKSRLILQVHDELLIDMAKGEENVVKELLADEMIHAAKLLVDLEIDAHTGATWFEAK